MHIKKYMCGQSRKKGVLSEPQGVMSSSVQTGTFSLLFEPIMVTILVTLSFLAAAIIIIDTLFAGTLGIHKVNEIANFDPFCLPQDKVVIECSEYSVEKSDEKVVARMTWLNLTEQPALLIYKESATGNVRQFLQFGKSIEAEANRSLWDDVEHIPYMVDIKSTNTSNCKHTYILSCPKLVAEIRQMRKTHQEEALQLCSSLRDWIANTFKVIFCGAILIGTPGIGFVLLAKLFDFLMNHGSEFKQIQELVNDFKHDDDNDDDDMVVM